MMIEMIWKGADGFTPGIGNTESGKPITVSDDMAKHLKQSGLADYSAKPPAKTHKGEV